MRGPVPEGVLLQRVIGTYSIHFGQGDEFAFWICYQELTIERNVDVREQLVEVRQDLQVQQPGTVRQGHVFGQLSDIRTDISGTLLATPVITCSKL